MKRLKLITYLNRCGCVFLREGTRHTLFINPLLDKVSSVPRHREVDDLLAEKICKDLGVKSRSNGKLSSLFSQNLRCDFLHSFFAFSPMGTEQIFESAPKTIK